MQDAGPRGTGPTCLEMLPLDAPPVADDRDDQTMLESVSGEEANVRFNCQRIHHDVLRTSESIMGLSDANADLKPGIIAQGRAFLDGIIRAIPLPRSPATLAVDLGVLDPVRHVDSPNSATLQAAVSSLQREADAQLGNLPVLPAQISYSSESVSSYEEVMLAVGANVSFSGLLGSAGFSSEFGSQREHRSTTVVVKLLQPMYTISFADDELPTEASFFGPGVDASDFAAQCSAGVLGPDNPPVFIKSVTYGRVVIFTITTEEAINAQDLNNLIHASFFGVNGDLSARSQYQAIVAQSSIKVLALGGSQDDALAAIRSGDYTQFFNPAPASTGVPLNFRANYLRGSRPTAKIASALSYVAETCTINRCVDTDHTDSWNVVVHQYNAGNQNPLNTGIGIQPGDRIAATPGGSIWAGVFATGCNGPDGWNNLANDSNFPAPNLRVFALIARVGTSGWNAVPSSGWSVVAPNDWNGVLEMATNDNDPASGDDCRSQGNTGYTVLIRRTRTTCDWPN